MRITHKQNESMSNFDELEEGDFCDFCGNPISFLDDDWAVCPSCQAEYSNMDYHGTQHEDELTQEFKLSQRTARAFES